MSKNKTILAAAIATIIASASTAHAAEFKSGAYLGAHGSVLSDGESGFSSSTDYGYSESKMEDSMDLNGDVEVGLHAGYNWLMPVIFPMADRGVTLLLGLELNGSYGGPDGSKVKVATGTDTYEDGDEVDFTSTHGESREMTWNTEFRLRAGVVYKSVALYAFGGPVIAGIEEGSSYETVYSDGDVYGNKSSTDQFAFGYVVGGGVEWQVTNCLSVLAEVAYRDLTVNESKYSYNGSLGSKEQSDMRDTSVSVGMNFRF